MALLSSFVRKVFAITLSLLSTQGLAAPVLSINTQPNEALEAALVSQFALQNKQYDVALSTLLDLAKEQQNPALAERALGIAILIDNIPAALQAAEIWAQSAPKNAGAQRTALYLTIIYKEPQDALLYLTQLLQSSDNEPFDSLLKVINSLDTPEQQKQMLVLLSLFNKKYSDNQITLLSQSYLSFLTKDEKSAAELVEQVLTLNPTSLSAIVLKVQILVGQQQYQAAENFLQKAIQKSPTTGELKLLLAKVMADSKHYADAEKYLSELTKDKKLAGDAYLDLGNLALTQNNVVQARKYLLQASNYPEQAAAAYYLLGRIAEELNDDKQAISWYEKIEISDQYIPARIRGTYLLRQIQNDESALNFLHQTIVNSHTQARQLFITEIDILLNSSKNEEALVVFNQALQVLPNDIILLKTIEKIWIKALNKYPQDPYLLQAKSYFDINNKVKTTP